MFLGEYSHTLDKEFRLALPAPLRDAAGEQLAGGLCLTRGTEPCVVAYARERLAQLLAGLDTDPSVDKSSAREFKRAFGSGAAVVVPDAQGRIRLPEFLREYAGIRKDVTVVGAVDAVEIWDAATYRERASARRAAFERLAPRVLG